MIPPAVDSGDTAWVLLCSALVLLMTVGLALFYGGLVRPKNALNTMLMSVVALGAVGLLWVVAGYSLSFAPGSPWLGSLRWVLLREVGTSPNPDYAATIPALAHAAYQGMFAIITPALISGAVVERMRFRSYVLFVAAWSLVVYAPLAHWMWAGGGWLQRLGALDFAGGTVVHVSAGTSALVAAWYLGPRRDYRRVALAPHSVPLVLLGAGILWFGWFGFNAGSSLAANGLAALAFVNTNTAAGTALVVWALLDEMRSRRITAVGAATGAVVGLVGITPAAGFVTPTAAIAIGAVCSVVSYTAIQWRSRTRLDDSLDVFSCHGLAGVAGALLTGVFATRAANPAGADGLLAGNAVQVSVQALAVAAAATLSAAGTLVLLALVRLVAGVRVAMKNEIEGLDVTEHGEEAYFGGGVGSMAGPGVALESVIVSHTPR